MFHGPKDYLDAAKDPAATADDLHELAHSDYVFVDIAIASHRSTSPETLRHLLTKADRDDWNGDELLRALASNPNTSPDVLALISERVPRLLHERDRQQGFAAGVAVSQRPDTPLGALVLLLNNPQTTTEFRKVVARETNRPDLLAILRGDRSERVRRAAIGNRLA